MSIDFDFIASLEGKAIKRGYVPCYRNGEPIGASGVTVATGVDIGTKSIAEIEGWHIPQPLKEKLIPFANKNKWDAINFLEENPLLLTDEEVAILDTCVKNIHLNQIMNLYNSQSVQPWNEIPDAAKTIIFSLGYQYGPRLDRKTPKFWNTAINSDWMAMFDELVDFGDAYDIRRKKEAKYLADNL